MKFKIAIVGLGGVGGYFGGRLAAFYQNDENVEIYFMARGEHLIQIKEKWIKNNTGQKKMDSTSCNGN